MSWDTQLYKVTLELVDPMLGTVPKSKHLFAAHIAAKQGKALKREGWSAEEIEEEIAATVEGVEELDEMEQGLTTFLRNEKGDYIVRDYMVKGLLKEAARVKKQYGNLKQLKSKVSQTVFIRPREIVVAKKDAKLVVIERPLRASTPQGERTAIARSESLPEGTELTFEVTCLEGVISEKCLKMLFEYGQFQGLGQWRSSGAGRVKIKSFAAV